MGAIFDKQETFLLAIVLQLVIFSRQAKEVDGDDSFSCNTGMVQLFVKVADVDVVGSLVYVDKDRSGADHSHRLGSGKEGEVGHKDGIAGTDTQSHQCQTQGIGAIGTGDAVFHSHIVG